MDPCNSSPQTHLYIFFVQINVPGKYVPVNVYISSLTRYVKVATTDTSIKGRSRRRSLKLSVKLRHCAQFGHTQSQRGRKGSQLPRRTRCVVLKCQYIEFPAEFVKGKLRVWFGVYFNARTTFNTLQKP